jgi:glucose-6-phosphate dehydrogenase assembly protein OpcA
MAAESPKVFPLAEPTMVDVAGIERELEELWRANAEHEDHAVLRAAAFTLVYAMREISDGGAAAQMLAAITETHPARVILLQLGDPAAASSQQAWVTSYCHKPSGDSPPVCSDYVTLQSAGVSSALISSTILPLLLPGLPSLLVWDPSLPPTDNLLNALGKHMQRVVISVIPPCGPASKLSEFFQLADSLGERPVVTDLAESLMKPWRSAIASLFDADPASAMDIREIRMLYGESKIPAEMLLLAAWMSVLLGWKPERIILHGTHPAATFAGNRLIDFCTDASHRDREAIDFRLNRNGNETILRCDEPMGDNRLLTLLLNELNIWGRDPVRNESLLRARNWLKELLFS